MHVEVIAKLLLLVTSQSVTCTVGMYAVVSACYNYGWLVVAVAVMSSRHVKQRRMFSTVNSFVLFLTACWLMASLGLPKLPARLRTFARTL